MIFLSTHFLPRKTPVFFCERKNNITSIVEDNGFQINPSSTTITLIAFGPFIGTVSRIGTHFFRPMQHGRVYQGDFDGVAYKGGNLSFDTAL